MQDNNKNTLLVELLGTRLINPDGAGLAIERLTQAKLVQLYSWFTDDHGGKAGALLLELAPILDTVIEMQSYLPPYPVPYEPETNAGTAEAAEGTPDSEPRHSETPADPQPEAAPAASQHQDPIEACSPQARCFAFFGSGLALGLQYLHLHTEQTDFPFPINRTIEDFLGFISRDEYNPLPEPSMYTEGDNIVGPTCLTKRLVELVPDLDLILRAAYRLAFRAQREAVEEEGSDLHLRFIFFAGLIAAGLDLAGPAQAGFQQDPATNKNTQQRKGF